MCGAEAGSEKQPPAPQPAPRSRKTQQQASRRVPFDSVLLRFGVDNLHFFPGEGGAGPGSQVAHKSSLPWGPSWAPSHLCKPNKGDPPKVSLVLLPFVPWMGCGGLWVPSRWCCRPPGLDAPLTRSWDEFRGVRNWWEGWCEHPEELTRVGAVPRSNGTPLESRSQDPAPGQISRHGRKGADSQVWVTGLSGWQGWVALAVPVTAGICATVSSRVLTLGQVSVPGADPRAPPQRESALSAHPINLCKPKGTSCWRRGGRR